MLVMCKYLCVCLFSSYPFCFGTLTTPQSEGFALRSFEKQPRSTLGAIHSATNDPKGLKDIERRSARLVFPHISAPPPSLTHSPTRVAVVAGGGCACLVAACSWMALLLLFAGKV